MGYKRIIIKKEYSKTDEIEVSANQLMDVNFDAVVVRNNGELTHKALYLPDYMQGKVEKWIIAEDSYGVLCAVPLKKV